MGDGVTHKAQNNDIDINATSQTGSVGSESCGAEGARRYNSAPRVKHTLAPSPERLVIELQRVRAPLVTHWDQRASELWDMHTDCLFVC